MFQHIRRDAVHRLPSWLCAAALLLLLAACALIAPRSAWEDRLADNSVVMLGEVHDNEIGRAHV